MPPRQTNRIPEFLSDLQKQVRAAELAAAERIRDDAKDRVPVDPNAETHLRDAIHTKADDDGVWVIAGDNKHWWGHIIEHGSVKMAPRPFLVPALEAQADSFVEGVREAIRRSA